jgi:hypothetical protein
MLMMPVTHRMIRTTSFKDLQVRVASGAFGRGPLRQARQGGQRLAIGDEAHLDRRERMLAIRLDDTVVAFRLGGRDRTRRSRALQALGRLVADGMARRWHDPRAAGGPARRQRDRVPDRAHPPSARPL